MRYENVVEAEFVERNNRFIAHCKLGDEILKTYVPNTGRCAELFIKGAKVYLTKNNDKNRKTEYTLVSVYKGSRLINIDSQAPNKIVFEALKNGNLSQEFPNIKLLQREKTFGNSRFDIYLESGRDKVYMEVKGVTLEKNNIALFPDAPTIRGVKHLKELVKAVETGYKSYILFLIQMEDVEIFTPNTEMHRDFANALWHAQEKGVKILVYNCSLSKDKVLFGNPANIVGEHFVPRVAEPVDSEQILKIYGEAKDLLCSEGVNQWQDGYPNKDSLKKDMDKGISHILERAGEVVATSALDFEPELTYSKIYEGKWIGKENYGTIHRTAVLSSLRAQGAALTLVSYFKKLAREKGCNSLRIDTHRDNVKMNKFIKKCGFQYCGIIYLEDGSERLAYEIIL